MLYQTLMEQITNQYVKILKDNLIGIYLHGSAAFGCENLSSDLDFLVVTREEPSQKQKEAMIQTLLEYNHAAPEKGFEMSAVLLHDCQCFPYPTPYQLHYSKMYLESCQRDLTAYCETMNGVDYDLAAHFTVIKQVGIVLYGTPVEKVFGEVPWHCYLDSIQRDALDAVQELGQNPTYAILNLCRVWAACREKKVLSKAQGADWAMCRLPAEYLPMIKTVKQAYLTGKQPQMCKTDLQKLADFFLQQIHVENQCTK